MEDALIRVLKNFLTCSKTLQLGNIIPMIGVHTAGFCQAVCTLIGKDQTWKIERKNLNFRTHIKRLNRKTICFSKNEQIHDNVIRMYIEKYYYKSGTYKESQRI